MYVDFVSNVKKYNRWKFTMNYRHNNEYQFFIILLFEYFSY